MHFKKQIRVISAICGLILFCGLITGCDSTPGERVASVKNLLFQASAVNQAVDSGVADVEKVITDSQALLLDPNIPPEMRPQVEKVLADASAKLVKLKAEKQKVIAVLAQYQQLLASVDENNITPDQEFQLYATGAGQAAQFLPPPYRGYVYLAIALSPLIISIFKNVNQAKQINQGKQVLTEVVTSVDELLKTPAVVADAEKAKFVLQDNQSRQTQAVVDAIHDPMQNTAPTK
ncbi:MAG: hypothetical protein MUP16_04965 [Sedimentisphaerales bacterium]|nr:hypothetical protein [Sedimentisphaerales bacterium]